MSALRGANSGQVLRFSIVKEILRYLHCTIRWFGVRLTGCRSLFRLRSHVLDSASPLVGSTLAGQRTRAGHVSRVFAESEGQRFLSDELWVAEPVAGANRAEPLGLALGFLVCSHQFSGRSAR